MQTYKENESTVGKILDFIACLIIFTYLTDHYHDHSHEDAKKTFFYNDSVMKKITNFTIQSQPLDSFS